MDHTRWFQRFVPLWIFAIAMIVPLTTNPATAEIVYTPINIVLINSQSYALDLNNDGRADVIIKATRSVDHHCPGQGLSASLAVTPAAGSGVEGSPRAAALDAGSVIGPDQKFKSVGRSLIESVTYGNFLVCPMRCECVLENSEQGNWLNTSGFLGLEFQINGQIHYGWAHLWVQFDPSRKSFSGTLTGYAYETVPEQSIRAGHKLGAFQDRDQ